MCGLLVASMTNNRVLSVLIPPIILKFEDLAAYSICGITGAKYELYSVYMLGVGSLEIDILNNSTVIRLSVFVIMLIGLACACYLIETGKET